MPPLTSFCSQFLYFLKLSVLQETLNFTKLFLMTVGLIHEVCEKLFIKKLSNVPTDIILIFTCENFGKNFVFSNLHSKTLVHFSGRILQNCRHLFVQDKYDSSRHKISMHHIIMTYDYDRDT